MPVNTQNKDIRTLAYVLRRTNYGEADRILNLITPNGKISAIAKGVRREKSKLAGGIEMFSRLDLNIHQGKSEFGIITSAKMLRYFSNIIKDYYATEFAGKILKEISRLAESSDSAEYYSIVDQVMEGLDNKINLDLIKIWSLFNLKRSSGEEINLYRDTSGEKLDPEKKYEWDFYEKSLTKKDNGHISANEIKVMRLILTSRLATISKIKNIDEMIPPIFSIAENL